MFEDLDDIYECTDEEVSKELEDAGIDIKKAEQSFLDTLAKCKSKNASKTIRNKPSS